MPKVVVIERDNALVNVVAKVLPDSSTLLYYLIIFILGRMYELSASQTAESKRSRRI